MIARCIAAVLFVLCVVAPIIVKAANTLTETLGTVIGR